MHHLLVVDDDRPQVKLITFILNDAGYQTTAAQDEASTIAALYQHRVHLILLDVELSGVNGFDLCRRIRRTFDTPIIFVSGKTTLDDRVTGLQIGGDDYLVKPFEPMELLARVAAVLRRTISSYETGSALHRAGNLALDLINYNVSFDDGRAITLTGHEARMLAYLIQNAGRTLSTAQIHQHVWGHESSVTIKMVAVYIRRLRLKIEPQPEHPHYLVTIRGVGYTFVAS